jgi:outer membrane protein assembly factor BamD (BamD/ComL family)
MVVENMRSSSRPIVLFWILVMLLAAGWGRAQEVMTPPFALKAAEPLPGNGFVLQISAQRALEMGFPSIAADIYQRLLDNPATKLELRNQLTVDLVTALLDEDRTSEASAALQKYVGLPTAAYRLRQALVAMREKHYDDARNGAAAIVVDELPASDRSWYYYLQATLADVVRDLNRSGSLYQQAVDAAVSESQRTRFVLANEQARLSLGEFSEPRATALKQNVDRLQGRALYMAVSSYAVVLNGLGKKTEAVALLQRQLQALPQEERSTSDEWRLMLGVISGPDDAVGRNALGTLLANGSDRAKQRAALQLLARASSSGASRDDFRRRLDELFGAPTTHPLIEDLLLYRAQVALSEKNYARAETDASRLLEQFPGSSLKGQALGVLTGVAWEQKRQRNAANYATKAREALPPGEARAQLGVLVAEAYFLARDFRNAADAYAAALDEIPAGVKPGLLMFQRLISEVEVAVAGEGRADRFDQAQALLDQMARDNRFDTDNRWKAEWNLARALEAAGEITKAYARLTRLMATPAEVAGLPPDLRAQLGWLQASLSLKAGEPARTLTLADRLLDSLEGAETGLRSQIASMTMLLQAQANFAVTPPNADAALERLGKLREEYKNSDAAVYSYIVEADNAASRGQLVDAQALAQKLADEYPKNSYAPYALYQAAQYAGRRGQKKYFDDAFNILERLVKNYPKSDLVFYARLKQGNLLRLTNDNPGAQGIFEPLVNEFSQHQDVLAARLALADCHAAQATADASHQEKAAAYYQGLMDLQSAPPDIRTEAGYKYGLGLSERGDVSRAMEEWGRLITIFLPDDAKAASLGAKGRVWISKTLFKMGDVFEKQTKPEQAREAYDLIVRKDLPYAALAQERLGRFRLPKTP